MKTLFVCLLALEITLLSAVAQDSAPPKPSPSGPDEIAKYAPARDGSHDFDFLIGNWKAHVRRLPDRLVGSTKWIEYDGISNHKIGRAHV